VEDTSLRLNSCKIYFVTETEWVLNPGIQSTKEQKDFRQTNVVLFKQ
jgi:hypothetical protein